MTLTSIVEALAQLFLWLAEGLGTQAGRLALLHSVLVGGMAVDRAGVPWAEHITIATLAVLLVDLSSPAVASLGSRLLLLIGLMMIGVMGVCLQIRSSEQIVLSTFAVLLVAVQDDPAQRNQ